PDGQTLVSGADYRTVKVWDVRSRQLLASLMTFSGDGARQPGDDWLACTPDGDYDGPPGVERLVAWRVGNELRTAGGRGQRRRSPVRLRELIQRASKPGSR